MTIKEKIKSIFTRKAKNEEHFYYEIYFCDTADVKTVFGKYTDHYKVMIPTLERAQELISSNANGWGHCTVKINDYTFFNFCDNTYFIIVKTKI